MNRIEKAIRVLQFALKKRFRGMKSVGDCEIHIHATAIDLTDEHCHIVARGPVRVATILRRKRRKK